MTATSDIELFSARICPYAHRTRLVLMEKGVDAALSEIDFKNKPKRFLDVSAYGKVPALVHNGVALYESTIINEYLDEVFPEPPLMPTHPAQRAQVRIWVDYCDHRFLGDYYAALKNQEADKAEGLKTTVVNHLRFIENTGIRKLSDNGPYWLGSDVSLLDLAYYPFFERLPAWEHYRGITLPDDCQRLKTWIGAMAQRTSVKSIANSSDYYVRHYKPYATG